MPNYMLFLHEDQGQFDGRTPDEMMRIIKEYGAWAAKMRKEKRFVGGEKVGRRRGQGAAAEGRQDRRDRRALRGEQGNRRRIFRDQGQGL